MKTPENFEEAMGRLELIVQQMESGDVPLENVITLYEESIELHKYCQKILRDTENKVRILQEGITASEDQQ